MPNDQETSELEALDNLLDETASVWTDVRIKARAAIRDLFASRSQIPAQVTREDVAMLNYLADYLLADSPEAQPKLRKLATRLEASSNAAAPEEEAK